MFDGVSEISGVFDGFSEISGVFDGVSCKLYCTVNSTDQALLSVFSTISNVLQMGIVQGTFGQRTFGSKELRPTDIGCN